MFVNLHNNALNFYSIFGEKGLNRDMVVPAAFQVAAPFGQTVGGTNPLFWDIVPDAQWDSWLTVAVADGNPNNAISSIGIPWDDWTEHAAIRADDGAIFWMCAAARQPARLFLIARRAAERVGALRGRAGTRTRRRTGGSSSPSLR